MGLRTGSYLKIWSARPHGKIYYCQATVTTGNMETGYTYLFNGTVSLAGEAAKKVATLGLPEKSDREHPLYKSVKVLSSPDIQTYDNPKTKQLLSTVQEGSELYYFITNHYRDMTVTIWDIDIDDNNSVQNNSSNNVNKINKSSTSIPDDSDEGLPFN